VSKQWGPLLSSISFLKKLKHRFPDELGFSHDLAFRYQFAGLHLESIEEFKNLYEHKHEPLYLYRIGVSYRQLMDVKMARTYFSRFLEQDVDEEFKDYIHTAQEYVRQTEGYGHTYGQEKWYHEGGEFQTGRQSKGSRDVISTASSTNSCSSIPQPPIRALRKRSMFKNLGRVRLLFDKDFWAYMADDGKSDSTRGIPILLRLTNRYPDKMKLRQILAFKYQKSGRHHESIEEFKNLYEHKCSPMYLYHIAHSYVGLEDAKSARAYFSRFLEHDVDEKFGIYVHAAEEFLRQTEGYGDTYGNEER
jgi:tetratricopeptide (TPR) repeat protein